MTGRVLGVDLGERRIGLACSDSSSSVASPLEVLERSGDADRDRAAIVAIAQREGATMIVVGMPLSLSGRSGPAARAAQGEIDALRAVAHGAGIEVVAHDERLTTVSAQRALGEAGMRRRSQRAVVDKVAAAIMLQSWLDGRAS